MDGDEMARNPFAWRLHESALLSHLERLLTTAQETYTVTLKGEEWLLQGTATAEVLQACETLIENWREHKPEVVEYRYSWREVKLFERALKGIFPHKKVERPLPGFKASMRLYGARSEHKKFQERLIAEQVNAVFTPAWGLPPHYPGGTL